MLFFFSLPFTPMKNENEEESDDRMLIGYSGYVSYERKIDLFPLSLSHFSFMVSINRFNGSFYVTRFACIGFSHHLIS
jgi:hypothetical protein